MTRSQAIVTFSILNDVDFAKKWSWRFDPNTNKGELTYHGCHPPLTRPMPVWLIELLSTVKDGALDQLRKEIRAIPQLQDTGQENFDVS